MAVLLWFGPLFLTMAQKSCVGFKNSINSTSCTEVILGDLLRLAAEKFTKNGFLLTIGLVSIVLMLQKKG